MAQTLLPYETIIVDGSDTDELRDKLSSVGDKIKINYIHSEVGQLRARNMCIDKTTGDIITFLDDDSVLDKDCLKEIKRVFDDDSEGKVGGVTGERIIEEVSIFKRVFINAILLPVYQIFARVFLLLRYGDGKLLPSGIAKIIRPGTLDKPIEVEYVIGANMSFRRKVVDEFRFDEEIRFDDDDFAFRVRRKYQIMYAPRAGYVHSRALAGGQGQTLWYMGDIMNGYRKYFKKNFPQTPKYRLALYWAVTGMYIRSIIGIMLRPLIGRR